MIHYQDIEYKYSYGTAAQLQPSELPEIVFSGRSNVGKSSLMNKIFQRKNLVRVSSTPGKTITINFFGCEQVNFVDLPGYGYAKRSAAEIKRWGDMIEAFFAGNRKIVLVFQLIDVRRKASGEDLQMLDYLTQKHIPFVIVFTKCDKLNKTQTLQRMEEISQELKDYDAEAILFSALSGQGTEEIREKIDEVVEAL
ncbi:MAG: YihA family ribosome biogenesis GTP-binding protein [Clostridia bacterium]|nr:YihA family ribosome biogenesis GTP-binding protein [Clostridia bacterium]